MNGPERPNGSAEKNVMFSLNTMKSESNPLGSGEGFIGASSENNNGMPGSRKKVAWSTDNERIVIEWCDIAQCYKWLNMRSFQRYSKMHAWFTIPAIILSTVTGTASFAQNSIPPAYQKLAPMVIGSVNIGIGILTTVQQYLKISELNESHRVSSIAWDKFARNIRIELAKRPEERTDAGMFLKFCRSEFDRLMETSPNIHDSIVEKFKTKFGGEEGSIKQRRFEQLRKPDICDTIVSSEETRNKWYLENDDNSVSLSGSVTAQDIIINSKNNLINDQLDRINYYENQMREAEDEKTIKMQEKISKYERKQEELRLEQEYNALEIAKIEKYIRSFYNIYDRKPVPCEFDTNITDVDKDVLRKFMKTYSITDEMPCESVEPPSIESGGSDDSSVNTMQTAVRQ